VSLDFARDGVLAERCHPMTESHGGAGERGRGVALCQQDHLSIPFVSPMAYKENAPAHDTHRTGISVLVESGQAPEGFEAIQFDVKGLRQAHDVKLAQVRFAPQTAGSSTGSSDTARIERGAIEMPMALVNAHPAPPD
jgi:hypothetical protein